MQLKRLEIYRVEAWQDKTRPLVGRLEIEGKDFKQELKLDDETCRKVLTIAAEAIKEGARQTADFLLSEANILQLEGPAAPKGDAS